jgi:hypothetical protein
MPMLCDEVGMCYYNLPMSIPHLPTATVYKKIDKLNSTFYCTPLVYIYQVNATIMVFLERRPLSAHTHSTNCAM